MIDLGVSDLPEDERLLPCGTAFTVKTVGAPAPDLLLVTLKQTDTVLLQSPGAQAVAVAPTPARRQRV